MSKTADFRFSPENAVDLLFRSSSSDLVGRTLAGRYDILHKLGEGGMGAVYLAEHASMGRRCALKVIHPFLANDQEVVTRFEREAANASRINHPNVAAIYDFGETSEGMVYLTMELVEGDTLSSLLERERALSPVRATELARQTAEALAAAHELGIVHRDLKPDNIMITRGFDGEIVKVVDFGIAKVIHGARQTVTRTGFVVGTPAYMSPEQFLGEELDGRSDVFSLGCILYQMLTGQRAFCESSGENSLGRRLKGRPPHPREVNPHLPKALDRLVAKALARAPEHRFQSALDLRDALCSIREDLENRQSWRDRLPWRRTRSERAPRQDTMPVPPSWEEEVQRPVLHPTRVAKADHHVRRRSRRVGIVALIVVLVGSIVWRMGGAALAHDRSVPLRLEPLSLSPSQPVQSDPAAPDSIPAQLPTPALQADSKASPEPASPTIAPTPPEPVDSVPRGKIVVVGSIPWGAQLRLDGRSLGPNERVVSVTPGLHWLALSAPGFEIDSASVEVGPGVRTTWTAPELRLVAAQPTPRPEEPPASEPAPSERLTPAQQQKTSEPPVPAALSKGTSFTASINAEIRSHVDHAGDTITATVDSNVTDQSGRVVIPGGSEVRLRITAIKPSKNKGDLIGTLTLKTTALVIDGKARPFSAAISGPQTHLEARGTNVGDVAKVGAGTALGAVVGELLGGGKKGALIGGLIGGAVGAQRAAHSKDRDIVAPPGATVTLTLTEELVAGAE
jgi:serine/threonine-protein kinase